MAEQAWIPSPGPGLGPPEGVGGVAVDATHVYWTNGKYIARAKLNGEEVEREWLNTTVTPDLIQVDAGHVYWTDGTGIGRATIAGETVEAEWLKLPENKETILGFAVDVGFVYWTNAASVGRATIAGEAIEYEWLKEPSKPWVIKGLTVDATYLYYTIDLEESWILRVPLAGGAKELIVQLHNPGENNIRTLALGAGYLFWLNLTEAAAKKGIGRATKKGVAQIRQWVKVEPEALAIAADETYVYWLNQANGAIGRELIGSIALSVAGRIFTLLDGGWEPHIIAAIIGIGVDDVIRTMTYPWFVPPNPGEDLVR